MFIWHCLNILFGFLALTSLCNQSPVLNSLCLKNTSVLPAAQLDSGLRPFLSQSIAPSQSIQSLTSPLPTQLVTEADDCGSSMPPEPSPPLVPTPAAWAKSFSSLAWLESHQVTLHPTFPQKLEGFRSGPQNFPTQARISKLACPIWSQMPSALATLHALLLTPRTPHESFPKHAIHCPPPSCVPVPSA